MKFIPETFPFPKWLGPYTPRRGTSTGFTVRNGVLGVGMVPALGLEFLPVTTTSGILELAEIVRRHWSGGRVLLLPSGHVIKPLQEHSESGERVVVGRFDGGLKIESDNYNFELSPTRKFSAGDPWLGPHTIGLECDVSYPGKLSTVWNIPTHWGLEQHREVIIRESAKLYRFFKRARPHDTGGRVRITVAGHMFTNRYMAGVWQPLYVGQINPATFGSWDKWAIRPGR